MKIKIYAHTKPSDKKIIYYIINGDNMLGSSDEDIASDIGIAFNEYKKILKNFGGKPIFGLTYFEDKKKVEEAFEYITSLYVIKKLKE